MAQKSAIGIDIGGTFTKIALVNQQGEVSRLQRIPTASHAGVEEYLHSLEEIISAFLLEKPVGIGITIPGFLTPDGRMALYNPNTPALEKLDFLDWLAPFSLPVRTEQDLNASALSEYYFGSGQGSQRFMATPIGTGVGVGMLIDGEVLRFAGYTTGDAGHIILEPDGPQCTGGCRGCAEALVTIPAIEREALALIEAGGADRLRSLLGEGRVAAQDVIRLARDGDPAAVQIMARIGERLGLWLASLAPIFLPDRIALCGGIAESGDFLLNACRQRFYHLAGAEYARGCEVVFGTFRGLAGVVGAAAPLLLGK
jgi:glucokinase